MPKKKTVVELQACILQEAYYRVRWYFQQKALNRHFLSAAGMKFGMMVVKGTMSALIRRFRILPGTTPISLEYVIALRSQTGMRVRLESR